MNKKQVIRLTEQDLHKIVKESVNIILKEGYYDFDDDFNADDVECPYCGSNNVEPISAIDTHYRCLDCGEEFYLDGGWEPDWGAMRHESHKRKGKNINEATTPTWKRWQGYTPDQKAERLAYMQQQIAQLKQQREYAKQKAKTARTPEEQQTWRNTKAQIDRELLRVVSHEHDLRVGKKMTQGAKERATIKRREDRAKAKNRIAFQPQDDPYYTNESKNIITCYGSPGIINGKYQGSGAGTILGPGVIYLSCNPPTMEMTRMYGHLVPVKVDVSNFYRAKDTLEAKKMVGLVGFKDEYSGILYHGNRDGDVCAVFDRNCIIGKAY